MLDENWMDRIYAVAEKLDRGTALNEEELRVYENVRSDGEAYKIFCLYTTMMDALSFRENPMEEEYDMGYHAAKENIGSYIERLKEKNFSK